MVNDRRFSALLLTLFWICFAGGVIWHTQLFSMSFPFTHIDEQAHYSYTMDLLQQHRWWPDFSNFPMVDAATGAPTAEPNYLNHPPQFYWLMKLVHEAFPTADPVRYRILPLLFYLLAYGIYARLGYLFRLPFAGALIYILLPILLYAPLQTGYYNNDAFAITGGMLACLASYYWAGEIHTRRCYWLALLGLTLAAVKLTSLLLVGMYLFFAFMLRKKPLQQFSLSYRFGAVLWGLVLAVPFLYLWLHNGSPAPNTPGQEYLLVHNAAQWGWDKRPHDGSFLHFIILALPLFADQLSVPEWTFVPLLSMVAAYLYFLLHPPRGPTALLVKASLLATLLMLAFHLVFAYQRYKTHGWLLDMFIRYYFPLLPLYGMTVARFYLELSQRIKPVR